jgi:TolA-binding protein
MATFLIAPLIILLAPMAIPSANAPTELPLEIFIQQPAAKGELGRKMGELGQKLGELGSQRAELRRKKGEIARKKAAPNSDKTALDREMAQIDTEIEKIDSETAKISQQMREIAQQMSGGQQAKGGKGAEEAGTSEALLATARRLRMQGNYSEAEKLYAQFIAESPKNTRLYEARFWLAKCRFSDEKWDRAAEAFTEFLKHHSDQRMYSQQAKEDRIYCWKVRFGQNPKAPPGLRDALKDPDPDTRMQAALALAENKDATGRLILEGGLDHPKMGEQCALALWKLGLGEQPKTGQPPAPRARMLVIRVKTNDDSFEMRVPVSLFKSMEKLLPQEALKEMAARGLGDIGGMAANAPKGTVLFQYRGDGGKTNVVIMVE